MLYMNDIKSFVPDTYATIEEAGKNLNLSEAHIKVYKKIYGIEKIPIASGIRLIDFIKKPIQDLIDKNNIDKSTIKYLIHCHTAKIIAPFGDSLIRQVKEEMGFNEAISFGTSINNCASTIASLDLLSHVLEQHDTCKAILVCGDYAFTHVLKIIPNTSILGEGSAAVLLSKQGIKNKLLAISIKTAGQYAQGVWLSPEMSRQFEAEYADLFSTVIYDAIHKAGLHQDQIQVIIPHNVNLPSWQRVASRMKFPMDRIYLKNIRKYSHCFGADIFINYVSIEQLNLLKRGDYYVMATVGLGAVFSAAVFKY